MAYQINEPQAGFLPINQFDSGITTANSSTVVPTPPLKLGQIVQASDPTYGTGEFILLAGVASTAVGTPVVYNSTNYTTSLAPAGTNLPQPIAVAMSANVTTVTFGWYQIAGVAVGVKTGGVSILSNAAIGIATAGTFNASATGIEVQGAVVAAVATITSTTIQLTLNRPHMQGRIT